MSVTSRRKSVRVYTFSVCARLSVGEYFIDGLGFSIQCMVVFKRFMIQTVEEKLEMHECAGDCVDVAARVSVRT